jgi:hypothetical protein
MVSGSSSIASSSDPVYFVIYNSTRGSSRSIGTVF